MHTPNPSRQRKNHSKAIARKGKGEPRKGGTSNKRHGGSTIGEIKSRYFGGSGYGVMTIPSKTNHHRTNKKSNRLRLTVKAKHKNRVSGK